MTRTSRNVWVVAMVGGAIVFGCAYRAGVKDNGTGAAGSGGPTGVAGSGGPSDAGGPSDVASPFDFGGQFGDTGSSGPSGPCTGLQCQQSTCNGDAKCAVKCPAGSRTTVSGTVFDPAGAVPLYNITVYVPNAKLDDLVDGPSCDPCDPTTGTSLLSGQPVTITKTNTAGKFVLGDLESIGGSAPAGASIPLVIQVGKWRRQVTIPNVIPCQDNPITDMSLLHLPRSSAEGHIPKMVLTTGGSDAMECLLRKIGIDDKEFSTTDGTGRINLVAGGGGTSAFAAMPASGSMTFTPVHPAAGGADWWDSLDNLKKYDITLHSCEGTQGVYTATTDPPSVKSPAARMALQQYADMGGRVFASHWHTYWFEKGTPDFMSIATFANPHTPGLRNPTDTTIDQSFDKGMALAAWMMGPMVMGSTVLGIVPIAQDASNTEVAKAAGPPISQQWIYGPTPDGANAVLFLSATTPIPNATTPKPNACGRAVLSDLHVSAGGKGSDMPGAAFPSGCLTTTLSPREKVLEFMLFDIASCVRPIVQ